MIEFVVEGDPVPQGSLKARCVDGRFATAYYTNSPELMGYRQDLAREARASGVRRHIGGVILEVEFYLQRPASHYGTGRNAGIVKDSARLRPTVKPDLDKLQRAVGDALTKIAWDDDNQVVEWRAAKLYADSTGPRTVVRIRTVNEQEVEA